MKPFVTVIFAGFLLVAGCQTSEYLSSAAKDRNGVTCGKIEQAFNAFQQDRQSAQAWQQLARLIDPQAGSLAERGVSVADQEFGRVRASVNLALAVRGCQTVGYGELPRE